MRFIQQGAGDCVIKILINSSWARQYIINQENIDYISHSNLTKTEMITVTRRDSGTFMYNSLNSLLIQI